MFKWDEGRQLYCFETDDIKGTITPTGNFQGINSLVHKREGRERVGVCNKSIPSYGLKPGDNLFLLDLYHYMAADIPAGTIGRKMKGEHRSRENTIEIDLMPTDSCRVRTRAVYTISDTNMIDLDVSVSAEKDYKNFELWLSSYGPDRSIGAHFCLFDGPPSSAGIYFMRPEKNQFIQGYYVCFPRDNHAATLTYDGRWGNPEYQTFITGSYYAKPIIVILNRDTGYAYIEMSRRNACSKLAGAYADENMGPGKGSYDTRIYTVLFGQDIKTGESINAKVRAAVIKMGDDFNIPLKLYEKFEEN